MRVDLSRRPLGPRFPVMLSILALCSACASSIPVESKPSAPGLEPELVTRAVQQATMLRASGKKVWCVPFARDASGIQIRGDAGTWWGQAKDSFVRGHRPVEGAVMAFSSTRSLPLGHVAVVSKVVSDREILVDHANWSPSKISLGMAVRDVSKNNDWTAVRVESQPASFGRVYAVDGFIARPDKVE